MASQAKRPKQQHVCNRHCSPDVCFPTPKHFCHARYCTTEVAPELLMCAKHWAMVPGPMKRLVRETYRPGQTVDKWPSNAWFKAAHDAIEAVDEREAIAVEKAAKKEAHNVR